VSVPVFIGDTGIRLLISLTDGGNPYLIADGCTAYIRGKKPDGKPIFNQCLILNNTTIQYDFTKQTSNCEGITTCEIELYGKDGTLITAPKFIIVVDSRSLSDSEIAAIIEDSDSEVGIIPKIIASIASEESRVEAEEIRKANELERQGNEANRIVLYEVVNSRIASLDTRISENSGRIASLENKALSFMTDSDVAYIKNVPENALPYAAISKIGGMTRKCSNLLKIEPSFMGTTNGLTAVLNDDGTVTVNGTSSAQTTFYFTTSLKLPTGNYYFKCNASGMGWNSYWGTVYNQTSEKLSYDTRAGVAFASSGDTFQAQITILSGKTLNNVVFKPMLNLGDDAIPFEPYFEGLRDAKVTEITSSCGNRISIPDALRNEEWYGIGVPNTGCYNSADLVNGKGDIKAKKFIFTGDEPWMMEAAPKPYFYLTIGEYGYATANAIICDRYDQYSVGTANENIGINVINSNGYNDARIVVRPEGDLTTVAAWKNKLLEWKLAGKHLTAVVGLAESTTKDISDLITFDNVIGVVSRGTITAENEHKYAVPWEVFYQLEGVTV
jgi:hypothetical protein